MTDKILELARECGFWHSMGNVGELYYAYPEELTRFYNHAQAAALREAAEKFVDDPKPWQNPVEFLRRMAEEKEKK